MPASIPYHVTDSINASYKKQLLFKDLSQPCPFDSLITSCHAIMQQWTCTYIFLYVLVLLSNGNYLHLCITLCFSSRHEGLMSLTLPVGYVKMWKVLLGLPYIFINGGNVFLFLLPLVHVAHPLWPLWLLVLHPAHGSHRVSIY